VRIRPFAAIAVIAVAIPIVAGVMIVRSHHEARRNSPTASVTLDRIDPRAPTTGAITSPTSIPLAPAAATPDAAVRELLDALVAGDATRSFSSLSAPDRARLGPLESWQASLVSLPHYRSYAVTVDDGEQVTTEVAIEPRLDETVGYVPARATVTWTTRPEDGGYRVAFSEIETKPVLPSDASAVPAATAWVEARQSCQAGATYPGNLLGQPTLADALCHAPGTYRAVAATALETFRDPTLLLDAFGPGAPLFVRVVRMDGPTPFEVALAPLGETWQVVGLMEV
jgi:hypothetical protein